MHLYRCDLTLHDYLFFATTERGKVAETGQFIHNYALAYALGWARSPWRNQVQQPHYPEEMAAVIPTYVTPAALLSGGYLLNQYNTMPETYGLGKAQSIGYPDWGFIKCFRPGARFRFYVIGPERADFPPFLRLGKFMAKARLRTEHAVTLLRGDDACQSDALLNWDDLTVKPVAFDLIANALPTRLVNHAIFPKGHHITGRFADGGEVFLPLGMGFLAAAEERAFACPACKQALAQLRAAVHP